MFLQWMLLKALRVPTSLETLVLEKAVLTQGKGHSSWSLSFSDVSLWLSRTAFMETMLSKGKSDRWLPPFKKGRLLEKHFSPYFFCVR